MKVIIVFQMPAPKKLEKKNQSVSWNVAASWYDELVESGEGTYQTDLILPNVLRLLELKKGEKVLDLACGQGFFSREFFKAGASVTGVDLSEKLIRLARQRSPKEIRFMPASADKLPFLNSNCFDAVACISAVQNIKNAAAVFVEAFHTLKKGGRFLIVMNHPAFRVPKRSSWGFDKLRRIQYRRVDEYVSESESRIVVHPGKESSAITVSFHRPLQFYFKALHKAGFLVSRLEEWTSQKKSEPGSWANSENKARREFPLFLALEARKPK